MKIGIPKALGYYLYYPFWHGFFNDLGIEVVLSGRTTKKLVSEGSALVVSETCLPVKVYVGHVLELLKNGIDVIYSPSIQSIAPKVYNCSKLRGLPDLIRNIIREDFLLIEPTLDKSVPKQGLSQFLYESVAPLGITNKKRIDKASKAGWECMNNYWLMTRSGVQSDVAIKIATEGKVMFTSDKKDFSINAAVISHGYNLYDEHISMNVLKKLEGLGVKPYTAENLNLEQMTKGIKTLNTNLYWANESEITGAAGHYMTDDNIDGVITITAFGCGPDSLMIERITRFAKRLNKPLLNLTIDEHTGEAGFVTRLEAFTDMLFRKKRTILVDSLNRQIYNGNEQNIKLLQEVERLKARV
ncbi:MAG: acyl-CoA dehydratase activase-related protein [Candidatus Gastranaerophilales bacterium]|nr:acyl-CoA dehydratase activase-related protein [Candidatus Gastranaerophilales bacterium]